MSNPWDALDEHRLREMRSAGMRVVQIAEELGVSTRHIEYRCKQLGIRSALTPAEAARLASDANRGGNQHKDWQAIARQASVALLEAIRREHPEKVAA